MVKKKHKKEKPRYRVQRQYEAAFKTDFYSMLTNMSQAVIATVIKQEKDAVDVQS